MLSIDNNEINLAIQNELLNFSCIKISFDTISIPENDFTVVIVRDSRGNVIGLYEFYNINKRELYEKINIYFTYKNIHSIYFDESCEVLKQTIKYLSDENTLLIPYKIG